MTALIYLLEPERVCIATDSLVLDVEKKPLKYATKFFVLPHMRGIICGTGILDFVMQWFFFIENNAIIDNIYMLDKVTPQNLRMIYSEMKLPGGLTSTIYHFGFDLSQNKYIGFAYRSNNYFESDKLIYSLGVKPPYGDLEETALTVVCEKGLPESFNIIMEKQRIFDEQLSVEERLGIGGEVHFVVMKNNGIFSCISHRFKNYESLFHEMLNNSGVSRIE